MEDCEEVIAVVPESCSGPGWSNKVVWVYIQNKNDETVRTECLQPTDQSGLMLHMFTVAEEVNKIMINEAKRLLK